MIPKRTASANPAFSFSSNLNNFETHETLHCTPMNIMLTRIISFIILVPATGWSFVVQINKNSNIHFGVQQVHHSIVSCHSHLPTRLRASSSSSDDDMSIAPRQFSSASQSQEKIMEALSRNGADKIASLSIQERTRRAMLAEAIEDEIFANTERLESLLDDDGTLPVQHRERAVSIAKKTKSLQVQYQELVSGGESSVLNSVENAFQKDDTTNGS